MSFECQRTGIVTAIRAEKAGQSRIKICNFRFFNLNKVSGNLHKIIDIPRKCGCEYLIKRTEKIAADVVYVTC